jgi:hypothetical protein
MCENNINLLLPVSITLGILGTMKLLSWKTSERGRRTGRNSAICGGGHYYFSYVPLNHQLFISRTMFL